MTTIQEQIGALTTAILARSHHLAYSEEFQASGQTLEEDTQIRALKDLRDRLKRQLGQSLTGNQGRLF